MNQPHTIDLRSDTVTLPTPAMREAMATAEVGDDVHGDDPTVQRFEAMSAELLGKEAAVYVPSGTMGNLVSILAHCQRGDEAIVGEEAHVLHYEAGGASGLGGVELRTVPNGRHGMLDLDAVEATIRGRNVHFPDTSLICLENTQNRCCGGVLTPEQTDETVKLARRYGCAVHIDGARIFNAAVALDVPVSRLAAEADSVTFCVSKGLSAPVGSVVCGSAEFIARARRMRKMLGGGMRQSGVIAAAGIVALERMIDRLADDHQHARLLAEGLAAVPGISIDTDDVQTNIVVFEVKDGVAFQGRLRDEGVLTTAFSPTRVRMVTHYGIERADIDETLERVRRVAEAAA